MFSIIAAFRYDNNGRLLAVFISVGEFAFLPVLLVFDNIVGRNWGGK
jgi:hypothetical protein